jgi:hypothetical protein
LQFHSVVGLDQILEGKSKEVGSGAGSPLLLRQRIPTNWQHLS